METCGRRCCHILCCHQFPRMHCNIVGYVIYDVDRHGFNGTCYGCTCFILNYWKYSLCKMYIPFVLASNGVFVCVYGRCCGEPLIINHVIDKQANRSKTGIKHKLLAVEKKLDIINTVDDTCSFPCTLKLLKIFAIMCQHKYTVLSLWIDLTCDVEKSWKQQNIVR